MSSWNYDVLGLVKLFDFTEFLLWVSIGNTYTGCVKTLQYSTLEGGSSNKKSPKMLGYPSSRHFVIFYVDTVDTVCFKL